MKYHENNSESDDTDGTERHLNQHMIAAGI